MRVIRRGSRSEVNWYSCGVLLLAAFLLGNLEAHAQAEITEASPVCAKDWTKYNECKGLSPAGLTAKTCNESEGWTQRIKRGLNGDAFDGCEGGPKRFAYCMMDFFVQCGPGYLKGTKELAQGAQATAEAATANAVTAKVGVNNLAVKDLPYEEQKFKEQIAVNFCANKFSEWRRSPPVRPSTADEQSPAGVDAKQLIPSLFAPGFYEGWGGQEKKDGWAGTRVEITSDKGLALKLTMPGQTCLTKGRVVSDKVLMLSKGTNKTAANAGTDCDPVANTPELRGDIDETANLILWSNGYYWLRPLQFDKLNLTSLTGELSATESFRAYITPTTKEMFCAHYHFPEDMLKDEATLKAINIALNQPEDEAKKQVQKALEGPTSTYGIAFLYSGKPVDKCPRKRNGTEVDYKSPNLFEGRVPRAVWGARNDVACKGGNWALPALSGTVLLWSDGLYSWSE